MAKSNAAELIKQEEALAQAKSDAIRELLAEKDKREREHSEWLKETREALKALGYSHHGNRRTNGKPA